MTAVACTLVLLCVSLTLVAALPAAKREEPYAHDSDDVLAGTDFLSVFMQRSDRMGPSETHQYDRYLNSVNHRAHTDLVKPYPQLSNKYAISNIFNTGKYENTISEIPKEVEYYQANTQEVTTTLVGDLKSTTPLTEDPTTMLDTPTTVEYAFDNNTVKINSEELQTPLTTNDELVTKLETTTPIATEKIEEKVISVRVSSSVVRHSYRTPGTSTPKGPSQPSSQAHLVDENMVTTLVTQEEPTITAVQRSDFAVEETPLPDPEYTAYQVPRSQHYGRSEELEGKVQEVLHYNSENQRRLNGKLPVFEIHFHNPPAALISNYGAKPVIQSSNEDHVSAFRSNEFRQYSPLGHQSEAASYPSRMSSPTSDSNTPDVAETVNRPVIAEAAFHSVPDEVTTSESKYKLTTPHHEEMREQTYGEPEKVYGQPEVNYEVDEAVSVITNGKAHGVQVSTPPVEQSPSDPAAKNKFGYVVEGRNFRKYRVEERTLDGFIVGEYGVVSHDDGSLRGVRYTADSTISPRLIYDTLVKFLSLQ